MKKEPLPFMGTHVANIALNKQLGLVFLFSEPQKTYGLTSVSEESMQNDQLQVARFMVLHFIGVRENERQPKPWIEVPEWRMKLRETPDPVELANFEEALSQICGEAQALDGLWNSKNEKARLFLLRLAVQINECVCYTNRRLEAIKICIRLRNLGQDPDLWEYRKELVNAGPIARELRDIYGDGIVDVSVGYLDIKNSVSALRIFAAKLLQFVRNLLNEEAIRRGYRNMS